MKGSQLSVQPDTVHADTQGQSVTGSVTFQIPTGVQVSRVQWTGGAFGNNAVTWNLG